ncbi:MAG: hypothetical protein IIB61_02770, partial [Planctomycetes bacterium]|nr:hypothetical protein [Planctomycetota bacterium]
MITRRRRRNRHDRGFPGAVFVAEFLRVLGVVDLILTPVGCLAILYVRTDAGGAVDALFISLLLGELIAGATLGGLLLGLAALLRYAHVLVRGASATDADTAEVDRPVTYAVEPESPVDDGAARSDEEAATGLSHEAATKILAVLNEIRDLALTPPDEREPALQRIRTSQQQRAAAAIVDAINMRQLARARTLLAEARAVHCDATTFERLAEKIDQAARRNEPLDYARNKRLVEQSIAEGRWAVAERYVRDLATRANIDVHYVRPTKEQFTHDLPQLSYHLEMPTGSFSVFPLYRLAKACRDAGFKVALSGEGADELFAGYARNAYLLDDGSQPHDEGARHYASMLGRYQGSALDRFCRMASRSGLMGASLMKMFLM